ncbi:50S ribosomal protein L33 [Spatholobus suberectus]|nr:50S ribosomal protein L33 [Spatholobus suberectus]
MRDLKTYLSVAPAVSTLWFEALADLNPKIEELNELKTQRRFMAKGKDIRLTVILECTGCDKKSVNKESWVFLDILLKRIDTMRLVDWN